MRAFRFRLRSLPLRAVGLVVAVLVGAWTGPLGAQAGQDIAVVVHPDVALDNLTLPELRRILLGDREFWSTGVRVTLLIRAPIARERDVAVQSVCQMTEVGSPGTELEFAL